MRYYYLLLISFFLILSCTNETNPTNTDINSIENTSVALVSAKTSPACSQAARDVLDHVRGYRFLAGKVREGMEEDLPETLEAIEESFETLHSLHQAMKDECSNGNTDPETEVCDGIDNDLDGEIDEGFVYCINGQPLPNTNGEYCNPGYFDLDKDPQNGCESIGDAPEPGDIIFNEVMYNPGQGGGEVNAQWIEFYNTTDHAINLIGSRMIFDAGNNKYFDFNTPLIVEPGSFAIIAQIDGLENGGITADLYYYDLCQCSMYRYGGDNLILRSESGTVIDEIHTAFSGYDLVGRSMSLYENAANAGLNDLAGSWYFEFEHIYDAEFERYGTPGLSNGQYY